LPHSRHGYGTSTSGVSTTTLPALFGCTSQRWRFCPTWIHLAYDFCGGPAEIEILRDWFDSHLFQRFSTAPVIRCRGTTDYFSRTEAQRVVVMYSDRPSNITNIPCVHIEIRINGDPLTQFGINYLADLTRINWQFQFDRFVDFAAVDVRALGRALLGRSKAKTTTAQQRKDELHLGWCLSRDYRTGDPSAAAVRALCDQRKIDTRRVLVPVQLPPEWGVCLR